MLFQKSPASYGKKIETIFATLYFYLYELKSMSQIFKILFFKNLI